MRTSITALYLVRDGEEFLPLSVATVLENVEKVIIINNRSRDGTLSLARRIERDNPGLVTVLDWDTDFDTETEYQTRNKSIQLVDTDWALILDEDQLLSDGWRRAIRRQLVEKSIDAIRFRYEHYVGSYEHIHTEFYEKQHGLADHPDVPLWQTVLFRIRPDLECIPACRTDSRFREFHHASFDPSMVGRRFYNCKDATCFHYGFSKRNMMYMAKYRINRGDYGHDQRTKDEMCAVLDKCGNPFKFIGHVTRVDYGCEHVPTVMKKKFGNTYRLELDRNGYIQSRTEIATGLKL